MVFKCCDITIYSKKCIFGFPLHSWHRLQNPLEFAKRSYQLIKVSFILLMRQTWRAPGNWRVRCWLLGGTNLIRGLGWSAPPSDLVSEEAGGWVQLPKASDVANHLHKSLKNRISERASGLRDHNASIHVPGPQIHAERSSCLWDFAVSSSGCWFVSCDFLCNRWAIW